MKMESRPQSSGYGRATTSATSGRAHHHHSSYSNSSGQQQGESVASVTRPQRVSSATRAGSSTYFDIANTILGSAADLDDLLLNAARDGDYSKVEQLLVKRGDIIVDIDCKDKRTGNTALIWAAKKGHNKIVQLLLRHGADPTLRNYNAKTAIEEATGPTVTILLDSVSKATESSHRLLLQAAWQGNFDVIRRLLSSKALDINCQNAEGLTPLMLVARDVQLFERLARDLNTAYSPVEVATELMKVRANVHARDNDGKSCLHYASQSMAAVADKLVEAFIDGGSEPAQWDRRQFMPIHLASQHGNTSVVLALLDGGSEVNCRGFVGLTPLHISAHNDNQCTAIALLERGADVTLTDDRGYTPVDLAKTRKLKTILKEAWTEVTQNNCSPELAPVKVTPSRGGSRSSGRDESPGGGRRGEVIFDGMQANPLGAQRAGHSGRTSTGRSTLGAGADRSRRADRQLLQDIENGRYTPTLLHGREITRPLGTVRNKPGPPVLPNISRALASQGPAGTAQQASDSPPPARRSSQGEEVRRSLEDGRNILSQRSSSKRGALPMRGRLNKTSPVSTGDRTDQGEETTTSNIGNSASGRRTHRRTGSDPFATRITDVAATIENIISSRRGETGKPDLHLLAASQHVSPLRVPLERENTVGLNIPTTIPEASSPGSSTNTITFDTDHTHTAHHSTVPAQMMSLPPTSNRILPPTPTFLTQRSYTNLESALSRMAAKDDDSSSSKEPSPRSDEDTPDNQFRVGLANPMELLRSRSLLKEEFILAESRPSDPFMASSGSDPASSSSSLSTASSSPREGGAAGLSRAAYRRSDPSLLTLTLREKAMKGSGFRKSDPLVVKRLDKSAEGAMGDKSEAELSKDNKPPHGKPSPGGLKTPAEAAGKMTRSQSLRLGQRSVQQQDNSSTAASSGPLKRSQSIGSVAPEPEKKQTTTTTAATAAAAAAKDASTPSVQIQDSGKGAPFSGKGRLIVVRDTYSEFDNVFAENAGKRAHPQPPQSSSPSLAQTSAKRSEVKPESAYIKQSSERSRHSSSEETAETPRMSVSDVAISGVCPADSCVAKNSSSPSSFSKQSSNANIVKPPVPNSPSVKNVGQSAKQSSTVVSQPSRQVSVPGKDIAKSAVKAGTSASPGSSKPSGAQSSAQSSAGTRANPVQSSQMSASCPSSSSPDAKGVPSSHSQQTSQGKVVSSNSNKAGSPPASCAMPSSTTTSASANPSLSKPTLCKTGPTVSSATAATRSGVQPSAQRAAPSAGQSQGVRKSASAESLSTSRTGSSATSRQVSGDAGRRQSAVSSSQKSMSASARNVTARLSGTASGTSRSSSTSNLSNLKPEGGSSSKTAAAAASESRKTSAESVAKSAAQSATKAASSSSAKTQSAQMSTSKSVTFSTATSSSSSSKPAASISAATPNAVAKVMQTWSKTATSSPQTGSTVTSSGASSKLTSATAMQSGQTSASSTAVSASGAPKNQITLAGSASSSKTVVAKSLDAVLVGSQSKVQQTAEKANADDSGVQSGEGIEPLVKITFSGMNSKPSADISKYSDPAALVTSGPVIVNPFENLTVQHTSRDKSPGEAGAAMEAGCIAGKPDKDAAGKKKPPTSAKGKAVKGAKKGKDPKRPLSGSSRQASAGKRRGAKSKDAKASDTEDARPKSGKRVRSGKRRGRKAAEREADKEAALLREMSTKDNMALISGIGWHMATACADTSDVTAAAEMHIDSSDSEDISDVESIVDAETLMNKLEVNRSNVSLTSPRFREIKSQAGHNDAAVAIPALTGDGFPPMNLDVTQKDILTLQAKLQQALTPRDGDGNEQIPADLEELNDDVHKEILLRKLTPIPEMPSMNGPMGNVAEAIARFDRSLQDNQLNDLLEGTPRKDMGAASPHPSHTQAVPGCSSSNSRNDQSLPQERSAKGRDTATSDRNLSKPPRVEVSKPAASPKDGKTAAPRRTQSLKEGSTAARKDRPRRERKFSESKKDEEEINNAIDEILSATNTSMSSTLKSTSTLKSGSNTLTEGDRHLLLKLQSHAKESPFHASKKSNEDDDDDASTLCGDHAGGGGGGEGLTSDTNPNLLRVMHVERYDIGAKVKAMIDAGAEESKVKAMMEADQNVNQQEAQQIVKVMNSFRHMELHAGNSQNSKEPLLRSESHRVAKVGSQVDRVPLVRPSSAGAARTRGRFHELKKSSAGGRGQHLADKDKGDGEEAVMVGAERSGVGAHGGYAAVVEALAGDVARDMLGDTAASETMCSRLSRHSSRSGSACTDNSQEEETIQWKKGNVLGKGAFGTVWCGLTNEGELIAVKQIELNTADRQKAEREYEKVQEEVELLKTLNHINIVGYLGTSLDDSTVSIFMQFVPGGSIASILARFGALDESVFRRYTRQILQGVEYLHDNDVIHRDIKGGNVMLMPNGIIKLIDFGCAKRLCINLSLSQSQILRSMKGTPYWMAPEVVNESGHGKKSDIWSIGCTVFEMATRKPPWADMNPMAAIFAIGSERPVPALPDRFSPEAIAFVTKCLTRNQQQRPSATELLTDIFMGEQHNKK